MIIKPQDRKDPFARVPRVTTEDPNISWKAKGLLAYLSGRPEGWTIHIKDLVRRSTDGEKAIYSALKELQENGYARKITQRNENGAFAGVDWEISTFSRQSPEPDNRHAGLRDAENPPLNKKEEKKEGKYLRPGDGEIGFGVGEDETWAMDLSIKFLNWATRNRKTIGKRKPDIKKWAKEIEGLLEREDISQSRFKTVLEWYHSHHKDDFVPQCETVKTFCERFSKVQAARDRWLKSEGEPLETEERKPIEKTHHDDGSWTD